MRPSGHKLFPLLTESEQYIFLLQFQIDSILFSVIIYKVILQLQPSIADLSIGSGLKVFSSEIKFFVEN